MRRAFPSRYDHTPGTAGFDRWMAFLYQGFAAVYDRLMGDVPYARFAGVFEEAVKRSQLAPASVVDLGCGTGAMFSYLLEYTQKIVGVDASEWMLAQAAERAKGDPRILLIHGRAETFQIPGRAKWCVSFCDVLNYAQDVTALRQTFRRVHHALEPGGYFLFDLLSERYLAQRVGSDAYFEVADDAAYLLRSTWNGETHSIAYDLVVFAKTSDGRYERYDERHVQRAFDPEWIRNVLGEEGFTAVEVGGDFSFSPMADPNGDGQPDRFFFLARRTG